MFSVNCVRRFRGGFTLMEMLVVVVVAVAVTAFAVPMYKKAQERNDFLVAQGILVDVYNAVAMCMQEHKTDTTFCVNGETIQYGNLTNPEDGSPKYLQSRPTSTALRDYQVKPSSSFAPDYVALVLSGSLAGKKYSAEIVNGVLTKTTK